MKQETIESLHQDLLNSFISGRRYHCIVWNAVPEEIESVMSFWKDVRDDDGNTFISIIDLDVSSISPEKLEGILSKTEADSIVFIKNLKAAGIGVWNIIRYYQKEELANISPACHIVLFADLDDPKWKGEDITYTSNFNL